VHDDYVVFGKKGGLMTKAEIIAQTLRVMKLNDERDYHGGGEA